MSDQNKRIVFIECWQESACDNSMLQPVILLNQEISEWEYLAYKLKDFLWDFRLLSHEHLSL
jgi:hypothetical protein